MPKQITLQGVQVDVQPGPDNTVVLVILDPVTGEVQLLPMDDKLAQDIGKKLTAPRVVPASNGHKVVLPR